MSSSPPAPPRYVVVAAIEDSLLGDRVANVASNHARMVEFGELHLVHVVELALANPLVREATAIESSRAHLEKGRELIARLVRDVAAKGFDKVSGHVIGGEARRGILSAAAHLSADLVVVGTHGRKGVEHLVLGSVAETVVHRASCPVLVVRPKDYNRVDYPEIEPACPDCLDAQAASQGARLWCERHTRRHGRAHTYSEMPSGFGEGAMLIRP